MWWRIEADVPGPIITDDVDLAPAILDADRIRADFDDRYQRFASRFCPWDDAGASTRVTEAAFMSPGGAH